MAENLQSNPSRKKFLNKTILDFIPDSLIITDSKGNIVQVSKSALKLFNIHENSDFTGKTIYNFVHPSELSKVENNLSRLFSGWVGASRAYNLLTADGQSFVGEVNTSLINNAGGNIDYLVITIRNSESSAVISGQNPVEDVLHLLAHELRQPINAIIGFSELIGRSLNNKHDCNYDKLVKHNQIVTQQGIFLQNVIDQIFSLAIVNQIKPVNSVFDVNSMLDELYELFNIRRVQINKTNISLSVFKNSDSANPKIFSDVVKIKQLFINIIFNAFKYTNDGFISFGCKQCNFNTATFFVSDTGVGIPADKYDTVFSKYTRIDNDPDYHKSVGLGLALSKKLASVLGGRIWFESVNGAGTTFYFTVSSSV